MQKRQDGISLVGLIVVLALLGSGIPLGMLGYWLSVGSSAAFPVAAISKAPL